MGPSKCYRLYMSQVFEIQYYGKLFIIPLNCITFAQMILIN